MKDAGRREGGKYALTFHYPIGGVQDHVSVRHLHGQWMSPGECVSPSSQKKRFILGVFSVGAVASLDASTPCLTAG